MLDLDAIERLAREAIDTPFRVADGADIDCFTAFAALGPKHVLALIAALRAVLETTPKELMRAMDGIELTLRDEAVQALAYLRRKAGVA